MFIKLIENLKEILFKYAPAIIVESHGENIGAGRLIFIKIKTGPLISSSDNLLSKHSLILAEEISFPITHPSIPSLPIKQLLKVISKDLFNILFNS